MNKTTTPYQKKLLDPRWQKKRLEILERDNWCCQSCGDKEETLHVHHKKYNGDPWDIENKYLVTFCATCHEFEEADKKVFKDNAVDWVSKSSFSFNRINEFLIELEKANLYHPEWKILLAFKMILNNENAQNVVINLLDFKSYIKDQSINDFKMQNNIEIDDDLPF